MFSLNDIQTLKFLLIGIPGLQKSHNWVSIPFSFVYLLSFLGNVIVLFFIKTEQNLHKPMYFFLSMLSISDLGLSLSSLPTTLGLFLLGIHEIHAAACFAQEFFIHLFTVTEASVLSVMAFDRYVAIHNPLKYSTILTSSRVIKIRVSLTSKNVLLILPLPFLLQRLNYCHQNLLSHSYCLHQDVMKLACSDNRINVVYGLCAALSTMLDLVFIIFSYNDLKDSFGDWNPQRAVQGSQHLLFSHLCCAHLLCAHAECSHAPPFCQECVSSNLMSPLILMADVFLLVPPLMNPIVYCVKTHQIREKILRKLYSKRS